uniref:Uncharacterized protein n=1 Tax=Arundo donax TaxID=35708 RepID=A0A0A9HC41_ARUDO
MEVWTSTSVKCNNIICKCSDTGISTSNLKLGLSSIDHLICCL